MASSSSGSKNPPKGSVQPMDQDALRTLIQEHDKALERNSNSAARQDEIQGEYKALGIVLKTLPDKISHEALVPIGPLVMAPGRLIHTNEIMCHLGDNYFVECSAKTALKLVGHRMEKSKEAKTALEKEKELIMSWRKEAVRELIDSVDGGTVEIREEVDEEQYEQSKKEHQQKVKKYHEERAKQKSKQKNMEEVKDTLEDLELWEKLDQLELEEDLARYEEGKRKAKANAVTTESVPGESKSSKKTQKAKNVSVQLTPAPDVTTDKPSILKSSETLAAVRDKLSEGMADTGSLKRRVSFDQSRDTTHIFERDTGRDTPIVNFTPPPAPPSSPAIPVMNSDIIKPLVVERNPGLGKKKATEEVTESTTTKSTERVSLFKQAQKLAQTATEELTASGNGDAPSAVEAKTPERISLFKQRRMQMEAQGNEDD